MLDRGQCRRSSPSSAARVNMRMVSRSSLLALFGLACTPSPNDPAPIDMTGGPNVTATFGDGTGTAAGTADGTASGSTTGVHANCSTELCTGHGNCAVDNDGDEYCACDPGYVPDASGQSCAIDESCIEIRFLEDRCRQITVGPPAVALFFSVSFCSGDPVLPAKLDELNIDLQVLENEVDIAENVESYATIIPRDVESYVTLVVDVSDSVTESSDLPTLIGELRTFVSGLAPAPGESDVAVSVYVFARDVGEYVPFTRDLASVDAALAAIAEDPAPAVLAAGNGSGTDLYDAVEIGIKRTQRIRDLRDAVSWGGVLTTGTVVVVTDGIDSSNGMLDTSLVENTTNNVISVGISGEVDFDALQKIGREGSFLAPNVSDWAAAFAEIGTRVAQYPERSYLLAYCSSATEGSPEVAVTATGASVKKSSSAVCKFDADLFSSNPADQCGPGLFATGCDAQECGGLIACGACADDQCCDGDGLCRGPGDAPSQGASCIGQDDTCAATDSICDDIPGDPQCVPPEPINTDTCGFGCAPGQAYCNGIECIETLANGMECGEPEQCNELNCSRVKVDNLLEPRVCRPRALLHDYCGTDEAICEAGGFCTASACEPRRRELEQCQNNANCRWARCVPIEGVGTRCDGSPACFWAWNEKMPT